MSNGVTQLQLRHPPCLRKAYFASRLKMEVYLIVSPLLASGGDSGSTSAFCRHLMATYAALIFVKGKTTGVAKIHGHFYRFHNLVGNYISTLYLNFPIKKEIFICGVTECFFVIGIISHQVFTQKAHARGFALA